jgi:hypothetical protein
MKKLLAILFVAALIVFATTTNNVQAGDGEEESIPVYHIPMPYFS